MAAKLGSTEQRPLTASTGLIPAVKLPRRRGKKKRIVFTEWSPNETHVMMEMMSAEKLLPTTDVWSRISDTINDLYGTSRTPKACQKKYCLLQNENTERVGSNSDERQCSVIPAEQTAEEEQDVDTEDASETDMMKKEGEYTEIKEQMYQDKLAQLKKQLQQLKEGTLPEYQKKMKKIEQQYKERLRLNDLWQKYELDRVEMEYVKEKKASLREFEQKKIELKENLIFELDEKRRNMDYERGTLELTGDSMEVKPVTTRKLRRRPNDPQPLPEKRRKPSPAQLNYYLYDEEIMEDLRIINKISGKFSRKSLNSQQSCAVPLAGSSSTSPGLNETLYEARIEDGRLYYDRRWFHRGQPVLVETKENTESLRAERKTAGVVHAVGTQEVWIRRMSDATKLRIYLSQLQKGKYLLKRRS